MFPKQAELDDAALVALCQDGDPRAWEVLVRRYRSLVWATAVRRGLSDADAADVFQATWLTVHQSLPNLRSADRLAGWIAAVARSRSVRILRRRDVERRAEGVLEDRARAAAEPVDAAETAERFQDLHEALDRLSKRCRDLLRVLYFDHATYDEASRRLGVARGSLGPTRARCLDKLRSTMEGDA